jgi:hypothetical protein
MEEENKSIEEKKQVKKNPDNPSVRAEYYESCKCPDYLQKEFPHCRKRMKNGLCLDKIIESSYGDD